MHFIGCCNDIQYATTYVRIYVLLEYTIQTAIAYRLFFAGVLGLFEAYQLKPAAFVKIDHIYRRNFGFIFNPLGKDIFQLIITHLL